MYTSLRTVTHSLMRRYACIHRYLMLLTRPCGAIHVYIVFWNTYAVAIFVDPQGKGEKDMIKDRYLPLLF